MCDQRQNGDSQNLINDAQDAVVALQNLVEAAQKSTKSKEPQQNPVVAQIARLSATAQAETKMATEIHAAAAQTLAKAKSTSNPAEALALYQQAGSQLDQAERLARRAIADARPASQPQAGAFKEGLAYRQAVALAGGIATFDNGRDHAEAAVVPTGTAFFRFKDYDAARGKAVLANGTVIDTAPLQAKLAERGIQKPLFKKVDVPLPNGASAFVADVEARNAVMATTAAPKVGGVSLAVSLTALRLAGIPEFQNDAPLIGFDRVTVISLKRWLASARSYASSAARWSSLPDALRFPGNIGRLRGFTVDSITGDVWLIGTPSPSAESRFDIDGLILALRASWQGTVAPAVSLDRSPYDPFGPNIPRIIGVPADSTMAHVMLDADYLMKRIMLGAQETGVPGYRSALQFAIEAADDTSQSARFWYNPRPLNPGAVRQSSSGRTILFATELQVLTEATKAQGGAFAAAGVEGGFQGPAAKAYTDALGAFAASRTIDPDFLITRLSGLLDAVTLAKLLQYGGVDLPLLHELATLPYRQVAAPQPDDYPFLSSDANGSSASRNPGHLTMGGGVSFDAHFRRDSLGQNDYSLLDVIEQREAQTQATSTEIDLPLRVLGAASASHFDADIRRGTAGFMKGQFASATTAFQNALHEQPASAEAKAWLAYALFWADRRSEALTAVKAASALDPSNPVVQLFSYDIERRSRTSDAASPEDDTWRQRLAAFYLDVAESGSVEAPNAIRQHWFDEATALLPNDPVPVMARARFALESEKNAEARTYLEKVIGLVKQGATPAPIFDRSVADLYSDALIGEAFIDQEEAGRLASQAKADDSRLSDKERTDMILRADDLATQGVKEAGEAYDRKSSALAAATLIRLYARKFLIEEGVLTERERSDFVDAMRKVTANALRQFPKSSAIYAARAASIHFLVGDLSAARLDAEKALQLNPADVDARAILARVFAQSGDCDDARVEAAPLLRNSKAKGRDSLAAFISRRCGPL